MPTQLVPGFNKTNFFTLFCVLKIILKTLYIISQGDIHVFHSHSGKYNDAILQGRYMLLREEHIGCQASSSLRRDGLSALMLPIGQLGSCRTSLSGQSSLVDLPASLSPPSHKMVVLWLHWSLTGVPIAGRVDVWACGRVRRLLSRHVCRFSSRHIC